MALFSADRDADHDGDADRDGGHDAHHESIQGLMMVQYLSDMGQQLLSIS